MDEKSKYLLTRTEDRISIPRVAGIIRLKKSNLHPSMHIPRVAGIIR